MEQAVAKRPGIFELVMGTWRSSAGALLGLLPLLAVVAAGLFGLNYVFPLLEEKLRVIRPASQSLFVLMVVPGAWVFGLEKLALGLVAAPAALATQRRILADGPQLAPGPLLRFWLWATAGLIIPLGALYLSGLAVTPEVSLVSMVLKLFAVIIPLLLLMIFPAVAADEPAVSLVARLDKGVERWDGNIWRVAIVMLFTVGPALLLQRLPDALVQRHAGADAGTGAVEKFDASLIGSAVHAALMVVVVVVAASALAWCFNFAKLPKPAKRPLGT